MSAESPRVKTRKVTLYLNDLNECLGWSIQFLDRDQVEKNLYGSCRVPTTISELLPTLDTVHRSTRRDQYSWTLWGGGETPIKPTHSLNVWLPGWNRTHATFFSDGSVQYPLGLTYNDLTS